MKRVPGVFSIVAVAALAAFGSAAWGAGATAFSLKQALPGGWTPKDAPKKVVGKALYDLIDGFADIHMGFDFQDSEHVTLTKGKAQLEVSVFRTAAPGQAFGLYSSLRDREGEIVKAGDEGSVAFGTAFVWRGPYVVEVKDTSEEPGPKEQVLEIAKTIAEKIDAPASRKPELPLAFPKEKLIEKGLVYFHHRLQLDHIYYLGTETALGLGTDPMQPSAVEAVYADYELSRGPQGVLAIRYPKPEDAAKALDGYVKSVKADMASVNKQGAYTVLTAKNDKQTLALQQDRVLLLTFEAAQPDEVKPILEKIAKALEPKKEKKG
jgi:hypothetical protein